MKFFSFSIMACLLAGGTLLPAQSTDPGAQQDAEAQREKLLKAADQLDMIQTNSEATKLEVESMKADVAKLQAQLAQAQTDNVTLSQRLSDLQAAFDKAEAARVKERQVLVDQVALLIASNKAALKASHKKPSKDTASSNSTGDKSSTASSTADTGAANSTTVASSPDNAPQPPASDGSGGGATTTGAETPAPLHTQKGYYHIVASGETVKIIAEAYREQGVKVTASAIRKANGLTENSVLKVGQKLFIPKPGT